MSLWNQNFLPLGSYFLHTHGTHFNKQYFFVMPKGFFHFWTTQHQLLSAPCSREESLADNRNLILYLRNSDALSAGKEFLYGTRVDHNMCLFFPSL